MVFLLFLLFSLFAGLLEAQPAITGMQSDAITRSTARVGFTTSGSGNFYVQYGTTTSYGFRTSSFGGSGGFVHQMTGMAGGTTYNWRICNESYTPPAGCSANQTLVTLADTDSVPMPAILPATMSTVMPIINGSTFTVASDCSDFMTRVNQARAANGNLNHEVRIPASAICVGPYDISPKNGANANGSGYIVIRSASADTALPPPGVRATRSWESAMPVFVNPSIGDTQQSTDPGGCSPRDYYWNTAATGLNKYRVCTATNVWTAVNVTAGYTESTTQPSTCAVGVYWYNTTNGSSRHSLYRCVAANRWLRLDPRGDGGYAIANNYLTALKGFRFLGLRFEPGDLGGNSVGTLLNIGNYSGMHSNVVVDRCIFYVGPSASAINALSMNGSNIALIDSYLDMRVVPTLVPYNVAGGAQIINITSGTGPFKIVNNYIRGAGILLFVNDNDGAIPRDDFEVRRNTFTYNDAQRCGSPSSDGICRDVRGPLELKRGRRLWLDGNVFENYWSTVGTYPAMIITPRASGSSRFDGNAYQVSDLTITNNIFRKGTGFMEIWSGDDQGYRNTRPTERLTIRNNLFYEINNNIISQAGGFNSTRGQILASSGVADLIFEHNTVYNNTGTGPAFLHLAEQRAFSGLSWRSNILWLNRGVAGGGNGLRYSPTAFPDGTTAGSANAVTKLNKTAMRMPTASYLFTHNAIVAGTPGDTAIEQGGYPSGNYWPGDAAAGEDALKFTSAATGNFRLQPSSPYRAGAASAAADGDDVGVNVAVLERAIGLVSGVRVANIGRTQAVVRYVAPDGDICWLDVSASSTYASPLRFQDSGGSRDRSLLASGLSPGTLYYYRLLCGGSQNTGSFATTGIAASATTITIRLTPPNWSTVATASISYGPTSSLGTTTSAVVCSSGCTITVPVTLTQALYWRANYIALDQSVVGNSRVGLLIP